MPPSGSTPPMSARTAPSIVRSCCTGRSSDLMERFIGIPIEHYAGSLLWLAPPLQAVVCSIVP